MSRIFKRKKSPYWQFSDSKADGIPFKKSLKTTDKEAASDYKKIYDARKIFGELGLPNNRETYTSYKQSHSEYAAQFGGSTQRKYRDALASFERLVPLPDRLVAIMPTMAQTWQNKRRLEKAERWNCATKSCFELDRRVSPTTVNIELRQLKAFFEHAVETGLLAKNPFSNVDYLTVDEDIENEEGQKYLSLEQIDLLMKGAEQNEQILLMAHIYIYAGLRLQEGTHLRWQDIDFNKNVVKIKSWGDFKLKDHEARQLPLHRKLFDQLQQAPRTSELICPGKDGVRNMRSVEQAFDRLYVRLGLPFTGVHVLRHTFITHTVNSGIPASYVQKWVGHASLKTTEGYIHKDKAGWQVAMKRFNYSSENIPDLAHSAEPSVDRALT